MGGHESEAGKPSRWSARWFHGHIVRALLGQFNVPGWLLIIVAIVIGVPDWHARYEFWLSALQSSSGAVSTVASILLWPYFSATLAIVGMLYVLAANRASATITRHPSIPAFAWALVLVVLVGGGMTVAYGYVQSQIQQAKLTALPSPRHLFPGQAVILKDTLKQHASIFTRKIAVASVDTPEANGYAREIMQAISRAGIRVDSTSPDTFIPYVMHALDLQVQGVFFQIQDQKLIPTEVTYLAEALEAAGVWPGLATNRALPPDGYILTIGPLGAPITNPLTSPPPSPTLPVLPAGK